MASTRGERLRAARGRRGFKSGRLAAQALGIALSTYSAHERAESTGGRDYGPDEAKFYARRFGVSPEWLLTGRGQGPRDEFPDLAVSDEEYKTPRAPVIGYVGSSGEIYTYAVARGDLDQVEVSRHSPETTVAVDIRSDVLGPFFNRWRIFYDSVKRPVKPEMIGELCVVGLKDGRVLMTQLKRGRSDGLYDLLSPGQARILGVEVEWAARVDRMSSRQR
jgi:hypothetical protein